MFVSRFLDPFASTATSAVKRVTSGRIAQTSRRWTCGECFSVWYPRYPSCWSNHQVFELWFTWCSPLYSVQGGAILFQGMPVKDSARTQEDLRVNCGVGENAEGGEISWENSASESGESEDHVEVAEVGWTEAQVTVSFGWKEKGDVVGHWIHGESWW